MKAMLARCELQEALAAVSTLTGGRTPKPILSCVKLTADKERTELCATDGEASLRLGINALSVKKAGSTVVPAERMFSIVRELTDVELALEADDRQCTIRGHDSEFHIFVASAADFPPVPALEEDADLVIDGRELRRMIGLTVYAAARETSRYAINGVLWKKQGKKLFMVATDGRRLARAGGSLREARSSDFDAILPAKSLSVFERVFVPTKADDEFLVRVKVMPNQIILSSGQRMLSTVLVEGNFPDYEAVIPKGSDRKVRANREELLAAVRRTALLTTEDSRSVKLAFAKDQLVMTSQSPEQGDARVQVPIQLEGQPVDIGFNPAFLVDALRALTQEEVFIELQDNFRPGVLCGEDKSEFLYVVMPVSL